MKYKYCIIDGNNLAWRYMIKPFVDFVTSTGIRTNIYFGVLQTFVKLKRKYGVDFFVVCWDSKGNLRKEVSDSYKSNRVKSPFDLINKQIKVLHDALSYFGVASLKREGYEADDLCYSALVKIKRSLSEEDKVLLVSKDHDFKQLIDSQVHLLGYKDELFSNGIDYSFIVYHSLVGDRTDNIKGVPYFRKNRAMELARQYKNVEELLLLCRDKDIAANEDLVLENSRLLSLRYVDVDLFWPDMVFAKVKKFCDFFELKSLIGKIAEVL